MIDIVNEAIELLNNGDVETAAKKLEGIGKVPPADSTELEKAKFYEARGNISMALGEAEDALDAYKFMIGYEERGGESKSGLGNSHGKVGEALAALGQYEEAIDEFRTGIEMMTEAGSRKAFIATLNFQLAECLYATEQWHEAVQEFQNTIELAATEPDDRSLGFLHYRLASTLEPLALFQQTIEEVKTLMEQLREMEIQNAELEELLANYQDPGVSYASLATGSYRTSLEHLIDSDDRDLEARVWRDMGKLQRSVENLNNAVDALENARRVWDENELEATLGSSILLELGEVRLRLENLNAAEEAFGRIAEITDGEPGARALVGHATAFSRLGQHDEALPKADAALQVMAEGNPNDIPALLDGLATVFEAGGADEKAQLIRAQLEEMQG